MNNEWLQYYDKNDNNKSGMTSSNAEYSVLLKYNM